MIIDKPDFFYRIIVQKTVNEDGTVDVVYECGHEATWMTSPYSDVVQCADCAHEWMEKQKALQ